MRGASEFQEQAVIQSGEERKEPLFTRDSSRMRKRRWEKKRSGKVARWRERGKMRMDGRERDGGRAR